MSLYDQASADTQAILEDSAAGFGLSMTLTAPDGNTQAITGHGADIGNTIDPETGQNIAGRQVHVSLPLAALTIGRPEGVQDEDSDPWLVEVQLPGNAAPKTYKIFETLPDQLGVLVCFVTEWTPAP